MANFKVETTVTSVDDIDTDDFPINYTMDDILEALRSSAKSLIVEAIDNDLAKITTRVREVAHGS